MLPVLVQLDGREHCDSFVDLSNFPVEVNECDLVAVSIQAKGDNLYFYPKATICIEFSNK